MAAELVRYAVSGAIAEITLDRAPVNALSMALIDALLAALARAREDANVRAVIVCSAQKVFCAGLDLDIIRGKRAIETKGFLEKLYFALNDMQYRMGKPTIAAVDGAVRAGGIGLMAACDLVVVHESTTFALTEVRIGVAAAIISVPILRRVPAGKIAAAMLTGERFDAAEARSIGLVTHVTPDVAATVAELCAGIRAGAPRAVTETKRMLRVVPTLPRDEAFESMRELSDELFAGPDAAKGMAAFAEKRTAVWD